MAMPRREITTEIQTASVIHAAETVIGSEIDVRNFSTMCIYIDYTNGDETSVDIIPKFLRVSSGDEYPDCSWSGAAGTRTVTADIYRLTATGKHFLVLDVRGKNIIKLYEDATGGTPTGTVAVSYALSTD
ncbi:MAG: hypothetical protein KAK00_00490 [Nanoarchaeota archaeon]|nr:hypothetical protein [Nanoarchaeota archaeon]